MDVYYAHIQMLAERDLARAGVWRASEAMQYWRPESGGAPKLLQLSMYELLPPNELLPRLSM